MALGAPMNFGWLVGRQVVFTEDGFNELDGVVTKILNDDSGYIEVALDGSPDHAWRGYEYQLIDIG